MTGPKHLNSSTKCPDKFKLVWTNLYFVWTQVTYNTACSKHSLM